LLVDLQEQKRVSNASMPADEIDGTYEEEVGIRQNGTYR
jgi:hypothetical protein